MIENEANASENPESLAAPARTDVPLAAALHRPAVTVRHRQRNLRRSVAVRTRQRLIECRFTRPDRLAALRARRPQNAPTVLDQLRAYLAEPISRIVENITAPLQQMMRRIAEMIRPSWLGAIQKMQERFQNLVRNPMLDGLRRIRERMATVISPAHNFLRRIGEAIIGSTSQLMRVFQQAREWASGFMTYGAKLRRLTDAMFSSWS